MRTNYGWRMTSRNPVIRRIRPEPKPPRDLGTLKLPSSGGTMTGNIDLDGNVLLNPIDPADGTHVGDRDYNDARYVSVAGDTIDQSSTTGAIPVLTLDQADVDEDYFKFIGISDTNVDRALVDAVDFTTPGSIVGWLKINVQDDQGTNPITDGDYYLPFYSAPTA